MSILTAGERRLLSIFRMIGLAAFALALVFFLLDLWIPALCAAGVLALLGVAEVIALVRRVMWTFRSPRDIARENRRRRGEADA